MIKMILDERILSNIFCHAVKKNSKDQNIRKRTVARDNRYVAKKLKMDYVGHVAREGENRSGK